MGWAGESPAWGFAPENIGIGELGDTALALASRPGLVAVCGSKPVETTDQRDALAVLLRPGQQPEERLFYCVDPKKHLFAETARDCTFAASAGDTLVLFCKYDNEKDMVNPHATGKCEAMDKYEECMTTTLCGSQYAPRCETINETAYCDWLNSGKRCWCDKPGPFVEGEGDAGEVKTPTTTK